MIQLKIVNAYEATQSLVKNDKLSINAKWELFNLRKELLTTYEFYVSESKKLISGYKTEIDGTSIVFESPELAQEYKAKQDEMDNFDVQIPIGSHKLKLSDIPDITVLQIEVLDGFIEFIPE